jgi:hypothetical protein
MLTGLALLSAASALSARTSGPCDSACLEGVVDRFLDAFVKHDPTVAPLAQNVKFTENGQRLRARAAVLSASV